ncbi:T9SS type A sorting domain-containing protein [Candidatus Neomarinimicrobiota bacterium]
MMGFHYRNSACGNILFENENKAIKEYISSHPEYNKLSRRLQKPQSYSLGDTKNWWVQSESELSGNTFSELPSTCMAVGKNCYIFVSDESWTGGKVTQAQVDDLVNSFDNTTPNYADKGIYEVNVMTYGEPPNFDGDDKIVIFLYDIEDDFATTGAATLGYFWEKDQFEDGDPALGTGDDALRSNAAEIFYVDTYPQLDETLFGIHYAKSTLAHEFQHMIHYEHDADEMIFVNEGLSEISEYICGYGFRSNNMYTQNTNRYLLGWDVEDTLPDYSRAAFWTLYLYEQFPNSNILKDLVNENNGDWSRLDNTIRMTGQARGLITLFTEWLVANYTNGLSNDSRYQYSYSPLSKPVPVATHFGNSGQGSGTLEPFGAEYITFSGGDDLSITFTGQTIFKVKALKIGSLEVETVTPGTEYTPTGYGTTYPEVTFLVYNESAGATQNYSYIATGADVSGTIELAYDDGVPDRPLNLTESDTSTVQFNGIPGAKLDSIKAGFLNAGDITWGVHKFTGGYRTTTGPFGDVLVPSQNLNVPTGSSSLDPFDNWINIDISDQNIDASENFIIYFVEGSDNQVPGLMASVEEDDGLRQYTFLQVPDPDDLSVPPNWYYLTDIDNNIWKYLIRAYLSIGGGTVAIDQNGIVTISSEFRLEQNYPNPFNPSTTFNFVTPEDGIVNFTVHDLLGRVVYSEKRNLLAGNYSFTWDGQNQLNQQVVSGVYFLRMETEGFNQTRKMLMMK